MRLSRTAWLVLGIGIFVIALATLYTVYSRQSSEQEELKKSLAGAQLPRLISQREALESQLTEQQSKLAEAQSSLSTAQASFPKLPASIDYDEVLSEIAHDYSLEVMSMAAAEPREKKVEDVTYIVISFEVEVRGEVNSMLGMVNAIATDERLTSAGVELVNIKVPQVATEGEEPEKPLGTIKFVGYSYGGE
jgi:hypothetical protein